MDDYWSVIGRQHSYLDQVDGSGRTEEQGDVVVMGIVSDGN